MAAVAVATTLLLSINSLYAAAPITNGLAVSVEANSTSISGTTWSPADGTTYSAALSGSSMYTSPNTYVTFGDTTNNAANFGNIMSTSSDISLDMWFYITTMHSANWNILATKWFGGTGADWHFGFFQGKLRNYFYNTNFIEDGVNAAKGSGWYHAAFVIKQPSEGTCPGTNSSGTSSIYLNGAQVASVTATYACHLTSSSMNFMIGDNRGTGTLGIDGKVTKFRFYTRALSLAEINKLYRADAATYGLSAAPYNTSIPTFSGTAAVASIQSGAVGTWINTPTGYTYQWYRSPTAGGTYTAISGATSINYTPISSDSTQYLKFEVTASNASGSIVETSTAQLISKATPNLSISGLPASTSTRAVNSLTVTPGFAGKVTFFNNGKKITKCSSLPSNAGNSYSVTCSWKPSVIGFNSISAIYTSSDSGANSASAPIKTIFVAKRSTTR